MPLERWRHANAVDVIFATFDRGAECPTNDRSVGGRDLVFFSRIGKRGMVALNAAD